MSGGPLIVQSDKTLLLEVDHPDAQACRMAIAPFAELERSPEHVHTYRLTPLGLWNARAAGHDAEGVVDSLIKFSRYPVPHALLVDVAETMDRYGRLQLANDPTHGLVLRGLDRIVLVEVAKSKKLAGMLGGRIDDETIVVHPSERGRLKQALLKLGWPAEDLAGYVDGEAHEISLAEDGWTLRSYQQEAVDGFWAGGSGVVVLPCGAGKTLVGAAAMATAKATTLILVTNTVAGRQWKRELIARTSLTEDEIGEYSGERKEIRPVTIATYQVLTSRRGGAFTHLDLFGARDWGLVIYDEVHLLPAPIFRFTADLQARRRLGLTATLVREDGREGDVFSLIGPKRYDAPWKDIEAQGWIAPAECVEVRVTLTDAERMAYAVTEAEERYRVAATARTKLPVVRALVDRHPGEQVLVIGGVHRPAARAGRIPGRADRAGLDDQQGAGAAVRRVPGGRRSRRWSSRRSATSPSTCPRRRWRSRSPARSAPARRRRSGSAGCCGPRRTAARRTSTRSSPATRSTPSTRRTGSASSPSRATRTRSWTPTTSSGRPFPRSTEVRGPMAAPPLVCTGRHVALPALSGAGAAQLTARLTAPAPA